jgi:hydroxymethylglutaryl-CoA lyase
MAGTAEVLMQIKRYPHAEYPVLVPNLKGLQTLLELLSSNRDAKPPLTDEIAVFVAASESFSKANINCSIAESIDRLVPVVEEAKKHGLRVRGYVSTVITCPFEGQIKPEKVRDVSRKLLELGCYEISLGDTVGTGTPKSVTDMLNAVTSSVSVEKLAVSEYCAVLTQLN